MDRASVGSLKRRSKQVRDLLTVTTSLYRFKIFIFLAEVEANVYIANANLSRSRTNHTHGGRVLSLRCSVPLCSIRLRLVSILNAAEGVQPFRFEKVEEDHHNHQAEVEPIRGLSDALL